MKQERNRINGSFTHGNIYTVKEHIMKDVQMLTETGCWIWTGKWTTQGGYGMIEKNRKKYLVHRLAWMAYKGDIPKGLFVLHECDVRSCVNPNHLFLGTHLDNMRDRNNKGRQCRKSKNQGEVHGLSKLTNEVVREIRKIWKYGNVTKKELSEKYNTSRDNIYSIVIYRTWKHIK